MPLEEEMRNEMHHLEREIAEIDEEIEKLTNKITNLINIRKKKEHNLRVLRETFSVEGEEVRLVSDADREIYFGRPDSF